jgi:HK97 family phage major capsid protein
MDEQKDTQSRYVGNGPFNTGPAVLWNRPRVESEAIAAGTALVGAFKVGGTVFQREPVQIFASDSHSDFFIRNLVAVLAEERLGFAVYFPAAFCKVIFRPVWA